jgi:hypothetical protein
VSLLALSLTRNSPTGGKTTAMLTGKNPILYWDSDKTNKMEVYHTFKQTSPVLVSSCPRPRLFLAAANRSHHFPSPQVQARTVVSELATRTRSTILLRHQAFPSSVLPLDLALALPVPKESERPELLFPDPSLLSAACR